MAYYGVLAFSILRIVFSRDIGLRFDTTYAMKGRSSEDECSTDSSWDVPRVALSDELKGAE
jgi:hypothetical protein